MVCVRETQLLVGHYQPSNIPAVRLNWDVRVLRWPSGEPISGITFQGGNPLEQREWNRLDSAMSGSNAWAETRRWLDGLFAP